MIYYSNCDQILEITIFRTETSQAVTGLRIDNGKKSKRLLTVIDIDDSSSVISDGWVNGQTKITKIRDFYKKIFQERLI